MQVVYMCPEMLETPAVAQVLHSESFRAQLSGIYIDEAHTIHESVSWRPAYTHLHMLRRIIGNHIPLILLSATLPSHYRKSIEQHTGLKPDYKLINLGNFRPELSTIVHHMQHEASSFQDLTFVLPSRATENSMPQTIIYCDNLDMLTSMFWWFHARLLSINLPRHMVDILHAGLSEKHQKICTKDFIDGKTKILLGSDKIGAGIDFPNVQLVVQYRCRDLTLVKWEQRRGRGARRLGNKAIGVILVEKSMTGEGSLSAASPGFEDPALLDLIHTSKCLESTVDIHLENPPRHSPTSQLSTRCVSRCSNCNPALRVDQDLTWIMENPGYTDRPVVHQVRAATSQSEKEKIFQDLKIWRYTTWEKEWMENWPMYAPESLISDDDLEELSKRAHTITNISTLLSHTHIPHEEELAPALFAVLQDILNRVCGINSVVTSSPPSCPTRNTDLSPQPLVPMLPTFSTIQWTAPRNPQSITSQNPTRKRKRRGDELAEGESLLSFDK